MIPESREGWAVDRLHGLVHRRYAAHARGLPRARTEAEVRTYLPQVVTACTECWPPPAVPAFACVSCAFVAKSAIGLGSHTRARHKASA